VTSAPGGAARADRTTGPGPLLLDPLRHEGRALDARARAALERSLSAPFGDVIVHTGAASAAAADRAHAAAFTFGRHVVFGSGTYDPGSIRGRMLLAHELAHVVQQRRSGGLKAAESLPASSLPESRSDRAGSAHEQAAGLTAAQAALGMSAPVAGSAPAGVARKDKDEEEEKWRHDLTEKALKAQRVAVKSQIGAIEGQIDYIAGYFDAVIALPFAGMDAREALLDYAQEKGALSKSTVDQVKQVVDPYGPQIKLLREVAKQIGIADKAGVPSVTTVVTNAFDQIDTVVNTRLFPQLAPKEDGYFTTRELSVLLTTFADEVIVAIFGPEELKILVNIVGGINIGRELLQAIAANPGGFYKDLGFWAIVAQAILQLFSLRASTASRKLEKLIVNVLSFTISLGRPVAKLVEDLAKPKSPENDEAVKSDIKALLLAVAMAIQQFLTHNRKPNQAAGKSASQPGADQPGTGQKPRANQPSGSKHQASPPGQPKPGATTTTTEPPAGQQDSFEVTLEEWNGPATAPKKKTSSGGPSPAKPVSSSVAAPDPNAPTAASAVQPAPEPVSPAAATAPAPSKGATVSNTKRKAEAGSRLEAKAAARVAKQQQAVTKSKQAAEDARARLSAAEVAHAAEPKPAGSRKKLTPAEKELNAAKRAAGAAAKRVQKADESLVDAKELHEQARAEAQKRNAAHDQAKAEKAQRQAAAALKAQTLKPSERLRNEWESKHRERQQKTLGARSGEQLHHAIELQVADIKEFENAVTKEELFSDKNIRVIPLEVTPEQAALLEKARRTPPSQWPDEVKAAVELASPRSAKQGAGQPADQIPILKDRGAKGKPAQLHQSNVRELWDRAYEKILGNLRSAEAEGRLLPGTAERRDYVRKALFETRDAIDNTRGMFWGQSKSEAGL